MINFATAARPEIPIIAGAGTAILAWAGFEGWRATRQERHQRPHKDGEGQVSVVQDAARISGRITGFRGESRGHRLRIYQTASRVDRGAEMVGAEMLQSAPEALPDPLTRQPSQSAEGESGKADDREGAGDVGRRPHAHRFLCK
jgi:hypothetical protein